MSSGAQRPVAWRTRVLLLSALAVVVDGCTFIPRGTAALRREAVQAGQSFAAPGGERRMPRLSAVPTPEELVRRALRNSLEAERAYWHLRAAIEVVPQRGTEMTAPMLGATVGLNNGAASTGSTLLELANMGSAPIEWPSKPGAEARAALQRAYAAGWAYRRTQFAVRRETLDAWYRSVADTTRLGLLHQDAALLRELDAFVRAAIQAGTTSPSAALAIEHERTALRARIAAVTAQIPTDRAALNRMLGRAAQRPLRVPGQLPRAVHWSRTVSGALADAVRRNPDLGALRRDIHAGRIDVERAKMDYIPDFNLSAATSLDGIAQSLGGAIMFPFVRYRAIHAAILQSRDRLRQRQAQLRSRRLSIAARLIADLQMASSDRQQIDLYERVVLPRLEQMAGFARADVAQSREPITALVRIERTKVRIRQVLVDLRLDELERRADIDALTAARLERAD